VDLPSFCRLPRYFLGRASLPTRSLDAREPHELLTAGFTEGDPHRMMHMRDPDEGPVLLAEIAPA